MRWPGEPSPFLLYKRFPRHCTEVRKGGDGLYYPVLNFFDQGKDASFRIVRRLLDDSPGLCLGDIKLSGFHKKLIETIHALKMTRSFSLLCRLTKNRIKFILISLNIPHGCYCMPVFLPCSSLRQAPGYPLHVSVVNHNKGSVR
jgi:hypothetical protein